MTRTKPDPVLNIDERTARWMRSVPEAAPLASFAREQLLRCDGCGEMQPESALDVREFVGGMKIRTCKGKKCFLGWKTKNRK